MKGNKTVVLFLLKFFGTYFLLFLIYAVYLNKTQKTTDVFTCAPITSTVAKQTQFLLNYWGYNTLIEQHTEEVSIKLIVQNKYVATIIEGCNSISVIILFISFIVAFASNFKTTFLYILFGSLIIYFSNILRIALITIALVEYPHYENILHDFVFPGFIYGITFLLWLIWVQKFSSIKK